MINILITGAGSYIGTSFEKFIGQWPERYHVDTVDMTNNSWRDISFSRYNVVVHVAGIAHIKETESNKELYYKINHALAVETAKKAKSDGVGQFIFISTVSVYGMTRGVITKDTPPNPKNNYGKSKLLAEKDLSEIESADFKVCIIRPPMVYGRNCKGNFAALEKIALKFSFFPKVENSRSLIYIKNLCEYIRAIIDLQLSGIVFPQDPQYINTYDMVEKIAQNNGRNIRPAPFLGVLLKCAMPFSVVIQKAFGTLIYEKKMVNDIECHLLNLDESIKEIYANVDIGKKI